MKTWCVVGRDRIWCATADGAKPSANATNDATLCGDVIVMRSGSAEREPDCPACLSLLKAVEAAEEWRARRQPASRGRGAKSRR